jgi:hypothetical protein
MRELVIDAWRMVVPKRVAAEYERLHSDARLDASSADQVDRGSHVGDSTGAIHTSSCDHAYVRTRRASPTDKGR